MAKLVHVELSALHPGMSVVAGQREFGQLEGAIPQPDGRHVERLITRRSSDHKLVSIPVDWTRNVENVVLIVDDDELSNLPEYVPVIPAAEAQLSILPRRACETTQ